MRRISIAIGSRETINVDELRQQARIADDAGVDTIWVGRPALRAVRARRSRRGG